MRRALSAFEVKRLRQILRVLWTEKENELDEVGDRDVFKGGGVRDQTPEMLTSKIFNTVSAHLCSCSCQCCYHIVQKYCFFFSPKVFCDAQKVLTRRLQPGSAPDLAGKLMTLPDSLVGWEGDAISPIPTPSTPSASRYRRLWRVISVKYHSFLHTTLSCLRSVLRGQ